MAVKMQIEDVFSVLLQNGYITSREYMQKKNIYTVHQRVSDNASEVVGHITEKQFRVLFEKNIIDWTYEQRDMPDGSSIAWYELPYKAKEKQKLVENQEKERNAFMYVRCATQHQIEALQ